MVFEARGATASLGLAFLLVAALAEWGKFRSKAEKGINWIALGGVWLVFSGATAAAEISNLFGLGSILGTLGGVTQIVGWVFGLIGTLFVAYEVLVEK